MNRIIDELSRASSMIHTKFLRIACSRNGLEIDRVAFPMLSVYRYYCFLRSSRVVDRILCPSGESIEPVRWNKLSRARTISVANSSRKKTWNGCSSHTSGSNKLRRMEQRNKANLVYSVQCTYLQNTKMKRLTTKHSTATRRTTSTGATSTHTHTLHTFHTITIPQQQHCDFPWWSTSPIKNT